MGGRSRESGAFTACAATPQGGCGIQGGETRKNPRRLRDVRKNLHAATNNVASAAARSKKEEALEVLARRLEVHP